MSRNVVTVFLVLALGAAGARAGSFHLSDSALFQPYIVVHPPGYTGVVGVIEIRVCASPGSGVTVPAIRKALATWNDLQKTTENCVACRLWEEGADDPTLPLSMTSTVLHELGHCALGLGHPNWRVGQEGNSFTNSRDAQSIDDGSDNIRGSYDDLPSPLPPTRVLHWFRIADNDPFVLDSAAVDKTTYSRRIIDLPNGHSWPANGNRGVALSLGYLDTQTVMYSAIAPGQHYVSLAADEINTVLFAMSGEDEMAGTADDYTVSFSFVEDCSAAAVEVSFIDLGNPAVPGVCTADLMPIPTDGLQIHYALKPLADDPRLLIEINSTKYWDVVFADGFESGDVSEWTSP